MATVAYAPRISVIRRPTKIKPMPAEHKVGIRTNSPSSKPYAKSTQSFSIQSIFLKPEEMTKDKRQMKNPSNLPPIPENPSNSPLIPENPKKTSNKTSETPKSDSKLMVVSVTIGIVAGVIALGSLDVGLYAPIQVSKLMTTSTTTASSGLTWCSTGTTVAGTGASGNQINQLSNPWHIMFDSSSALYIADQNNHRVMKWTIGSVTGTVVAGQVYPTQGSGSANLNQPCGVYVDPNHNVYVADTNNHRIQFWAVGAVNGTTVAGNGTSGSTLTQLYSPNGVTLDYKSSKLYVADTNNHRIMCFVLNSTTGSVVAGGNAQGTSTNQLNYPSDVYFDSSSSSLFIANQGAHTIVRWVIGANIWTIVAGIPGSSGPASFMLNNPYGLTFDSAGNLYVADTSNARVQLFVSGNTIGTTIAGVTGVFSAASNTLNNPRSIALDSQLNLYVSDQGNNRIQMFQRC